MIDKIEQFIESLWGKRKQAGKLAVKYFRRFNEFAVLLLALWLLAANNQWVRAIDPTAATYDAGVYQDLLLRVCKFFVATGIAWIALRLQLPKLYKYIDDEIEGDLKKHHSESWEARIKYSTWYFLAYLAGALYCMA